MASVDEKAKEQLKELEQSEQAVIHQLNERKVMVAGNLRTIKPLPVRASKKLSSFLNNVLREFNKVGQQKPEERDATALGGQDELLADALVDCLVVLSDHYHWNVERDELLDKMPLKDIKEVLNAQSELNEEDDFLLQPWRIISQVLSRTKRVVAEIGETSGTPASSPTSVSTGT